jgi:hypothetical protein
MMAAWSSWYGEELINRGLFCFWMIGLSRWKAKHRAAVCGQYFLTSRYSAAANQQNK